MKLVIDAQRDGKIFAAVLRLALEAGAVVESVGDAAEPDATKAGFGSDPFTRAPGVAVVGQLPIAPGANTSTTPPAGLALVPPPESAAGAPSVPAAPSNLAGGVELDIHGIPWDPRIHAGTQGKNADGAWKRKKGVGDVFYNDTAAELRRVMAIPAPVVPAPPVAGTIAEIAPSPLVPSAPVAPPAPPTMPPAPPAPPIAPTPAPASLPVSPPPPVSPVAPVPPTPADNIPTAGGPTLNTEPKTFPELMSLATGLLQAGRIQQAELIASCQAAGVPNLPSLAPRPDLIPSVAATIMAMAKPAA